MHKALLAIVILAASLAGCGAASDEDQLVDTHWRLAAFSEVTPAFQGVVPAEEQANYTIDFLANDAFAAKADCNLVAGAYTARRSNLTITPGPTTMAFCGEESYGELYVHMLSRAASYEIRREQLTITLGGGANLTFTAMPDPSASASAQAAASNEPTPRATEKATEKPTTKPTEKPTAKPTEKPTAAAHGQADSRGNGEAHRLPDGRRKREPGPHATACLAGPARLQLAARLDQREEPGVPGRDPGRPAREVHPGVPAGRHVQRPRRLQHGHGDIHDRRRHRGVGQPDDYPRCRQRRSVPGRLVR